MKHLPLIFAATLGHTSAYLLLQNWHTYEYLTDVNPELCEATVHRFMKLPLNHLNRVDGLGMGAISVCEAPDRIDRCDATVVPNYHQKVTLSTASGREILTNSDVLSTSGCAIIEPCQLWNKLNELNRSLSPEELDEFGINSSAVLNNVKSRFSHTVRVSYAGLDVTGEVDEKGWLRDTTAEGSALWMTFDNPIKAQVWFFVQKNEAWNYVKEVTDTNLIGIMKVEGQKWPVCTDNLSDSRIIRYGFFVKTHKTAQHFAGIKVQVQDRKEDFEDPRVSEKDAWNERDRQDRMERERRMRLENARLIGEEKKNWEQEERLRVAEEERNRIRSQERERIVQEMRESISPAERDVIIQRERERLSREAHSSIDAEERNNISLEARQRLAQEEKERIAREDGSRISEEARSHLTEEERERIAREEGSLISEEARSHLTEKEKERIAREEGGKISEGVRKRIAEEERERIISEEGAQIAKEARDRIAQEERDRIIKEKEFTTTTTTTTAVSTETNNSNIGLVSGVAAGSAVGLGAAIAGFILIKRKFTSSPSSLFNCDEAFLHEDIRETIVTRS